MKQILSDLLGAIIFVALLWGPMFIYMLYFWN
jgi:hypothetical protein